VSESKHGLMVRMMKSSSIYAVSGLLRNLVGFAMLPIYTRYLTPADYGIVSLMVFFVSFIEITLGARMGHAPQKFYHDQTDEESRKKVIASALFTTSFFSFFVTLIAISLSDHISLALYDDLGLSTVVSLFLVLITTQAVETLGLIYIRLKNDYILFFKLSVAKLLVQLIANVYLIVYLDLGVLGMATATAFSSVLFAGVVLLYVIRHTGFVFSKDLAKKMLIFTMPLWLSGLVSLYVGSSNLYVMNEFVSLTEVGLYSLAERLGSVVYALLFVPFFSYWSAERFRLKDRPDFDELHRNVFVGAYLVLLSAGLAISIYGEFILTLLTEKSFHGAIEAIPYLVIAYVFNSLAQFYQFSFLHKQKTMQLTKVMNWTAIATTILNFSLIPVFGFVGAAISLMFSYLCILLLSRYFAKPLYDSKFPIMKLLISCVIMGVGYLFSLLLSVDPFTFSGFFLLSLCYVVTIICLFIFNLNIAQVQNIVSLIKHRNA
jgi:O-antigen/teichoic acid export membrane protein